MTTIISGSSPSITFSDSTTQTTAANITAPYTSNGVVYASSTSALATGSALTFDGTNLGIGTSSPTQKLTVAGQMLSIASSGASFKNITPTTGNNYMWLGNTGNNLYVGKESSTGASLFVGSSAYAGVIGNDGAYPLQFATNNTVQATIDSSGNLGLGVTPNTWNSGGGKTLQLTSGALTAYSTDNIQMVQNMYFNSGWIYKTSNYGTIYNQSVGQHTWFTAPSGTAGATPSLTQVMTLNASGLLLVNATSNIYGGQHVIRGGANADGLGITVFQNANNTSYYHTVGPNQNGAFTIYRAGDYAGVYLGWGNTSWTANSDSRLKNVTGTYTNALADIAQIQPVKFTWKSDETNTSHVGVIAQSVQGVVPEAISQSKLPNTEDETEYLGVRYTELIPLMIASIQELSTLITAQSATIQSLTARLTALENK